MNALQKKFQSTIRLRQEAMMAYIVDNEQQVGDEQDAATHTADALAE